MELTDVVLIPADPRVPVGLHNRWIPRRVLYDARGVELDELWGGAGWVDTSIIRLRDAYPRYYEGRMCPQCWCNRVGGSDEQEDRATCVAPNFTVCECGHFRCPVCGSTENSASMTHPSCVECVALGLSEPNPDVRRLQELRAARWDGMGQPNVVMPFMYTPKYLVGVEGGERAQTTRQELDSTIAEQLAREIRIGFYTHGIVEPPYTNGVWVVLFERDSNTIFHHYHDGCWGTIRMPVENGLEALRDKLQVDLSTINMGSLASARPSAMSDGRQFPDAYALTSHVVASVDVGWQIDRATIRQRERLTRQRALGLAVPHEVMILGVGGVGWNLAKQLALVGVRRFVLVDPDILTRTNSNRMDVTEYDMGRQKTEVLAGHLRNFHDMSVESMQHYPEDTDRGGLARQTRELWDIFLRRVTVVVDCTDNLTVQNKHYDLVVQERPGRTAPPRWVRVGYDGGWHITVTSRRPPDWDLRPNERYAVPAWIGGAQMAATLGVSKIVYDPALEWSGDMRELFGMRMQEVVRDRA